ncbi:MAG: alpha/beta hydrolase [Gemmataceae bacterium]|nr:alpha/beta hydrolase [Gemmataceae bacterium]MDW8266429.1 alpha/beta hydrolase [Gemmataceae bacterium]
MECPFAQRSSLDPWQAVARRQREAMTGDFHNGTYRCRYWVWGDGPPLVCVPSLTGDAACFTLVQACLSSQFRCISYDLPDGVTDGADLRTLSHADLVDHVFRLLDHLGISRSYIFGASFGSTIALAAMHARPACLPRGILQAGFAYRPLGWGERALVWLGRRSYRPLSSLPGLAFVLHRSHAGPFGGSSSPLWEFFQQRYLTPPIAAICHRAWLMHQLDLRPILPEIHQPVLVIGGDADPLVRRVAEEELVRGLPHGRRVELHHCGHHPLFTHAEVLAELVRQFLTPPTTEERRC